MPNKQPVRGVYERHEEGEIGLNRREKKKKRSTLLERFNFFSIDGYMNI